MDAYLPPGCTRYDTGDRVTNPHRPNRCEICKSELDENECVKCDADEESES